MSETTNFGQASLVVGGITGSGPSMNVTSIRVSNTVLSFDSSTGSITANVYDTNGTLIRLSRVPIQIQSASQPASVGPGDEWVCTSNSNVFKYISTIGWACLGAYTIATPVIYTNFPSSTESYIKAMTSDAGGNVYATGYYTGTMTIKNLDGSSTAYSMPNSSTSQTTMLIKWNSVGAYVGAMAIPVSSVPYSYNSGFSLACDAGSNVYVSGKYYNALVSTTLYNLTANPNSSSSGQSFDGSGGPFLIKYNSAGTYVSGTLLKPDINELNYGFTGIACDAGSNVYFTGTMRTGSTIWNLTTNPNSSSTGYSLPNNGGVGGISNPFLLKFNSSGTYTGGTMHVNGNANYSFAGGVACDAGSNVYMTGTTVGVSSFTIYNLSLNPNSSSSGQSISANSGQYLLKYNSAGNYVSGMQLFGGGIYGGTAGEFVACDSGSNVYAGYGQGSGTATIYNLNANPTGSSSGYTVSLTNAAFFKWNPSGTYVGGVSLGNVQGTRLVCDSSSNVYYAGAGNSTIYNLALNPTGSSSGYTITGSGGCLYKYSPSGTYLAATSVQGALAQAVCIASSNVYYAGYYTGNPSLYNLTQNPNTETSVSSLPSVSVNTGYIVKYSVAPGSTPSSTALYEFTTATFTPGAATGPNGPIISQARSGLAGTPTPSAWYNTYLNMTTQGIQLWTVPATGTYTIRAVGGSGSGTSYGGNSYGGRGVVVEANFNLTQGDVIKILVGQGGAGGGTTNGCEGTGGGGTFVVDNSNNPIIVAGGGGGGATAYYYQVANGQDGLTTTTGGSVGGGAGGTNGSGGATTEIMRAPGAGFSGNAPAIGGTKTRLQARFH